MNFVTRFVSLNQKLINFNFRGPNVKVGHYTQMMWSDTSEIGCAATYYTTPATYTNKTKKWHHLLFVCDYGPGGNYISLPVYKVGKPCSSCPNGLKPNKRYPGLCGQIKKVNETAKFEPLFRIWWRFIILVLKRRYHDFHYIVTCSNFVPFYFKRITCLTVYFFIRTSTYWVCVL